MDRVTSLLPQGALAKARLVTAIFACMGLAGQLSQIGSVAHGAAWHAMSRVAVIAIMIIVVVTYRRRRTLWFDPVVLPVLLVMVGSGLVDAVNTTGPCIGVMIAQSLYGSHRGWLVRSAGAVVALPVSVALSPFALNRPVEWNSATVLAIIPQLVLIALVLRAMCVAMTRQEQAGAREHVLALTGRRLLGATGLGEVHAIGSQAITSLAAASPGVAFAVLRPESDDAIVVASAGFAEPVNGLWVDVACLSASAMPQHRMVPGLDPLSRRSGQVRRWTVNRLETRDTDLFLVAGAARTVHADVFDAFLSLSHQIAMAESGCRLNARLHHQANHDQLTALPTRRPFFEQLAEAVDSGEGVVALLAIDLDDFKVVNDTHGHGAGDAVLVEIAARLQQVAGPGSIAARFGGDEFAALITGLSHAEEATAVAERICLILSEPIALPGATVSVGASVGVAIADAELSAGDLMRCADIAMYYAKARGKNRVELFDNDQHGSIARHRSLEEHFPQAFPRGEIAVRYQPLIDLRDGACCGLEAVPYWLHPSLGPIAPADVQAVAERTGHQAELSSYVLEVVCRHMAEWSTYQHMTDVWVSVSVRGRQLTGRQFTDRLRSLLTGYAVDPQKLVLEMTESEYADDATAREQLGQMTVMGVRIALDDFGAGYSSLASLRSHPVHLIKLDTALMDQNDRGVLQLVASVAELLGAQTVVRGAGGDLAIDDLRGAGSTGWLSADRTAHTAEGATGNVGT